MHIVQILPELNQGGVERGTVELSRELVKLGHTSTVISAGGTLAGQIEADGGQHHTLDVCSKNPFTFPARSRKLRNLLSELSPSVIHARSRVPAWLCRVANKPLNLPFVTTVHGFNSISPYSRIMTSGDHVICVSHPIKEYIQQHYQTPSEKISVIHRCVDPAEFNPETLDTHWIEQFKTEHGLAGRHIVTSVGRITELKDYETFIQAIAASAADLPNMTGLIVGGVRHDKEDYYARLQKLVRELGVQDRIVFAGSQNRMPEIYALSNLLVSCSKKPESFGRTLVEAMAMNTPVVATRHGGALDIIEEGVNGELFSPGDSSALAKKIQQAQQAKTEQLRERTLEYFSLQKMVTETLKVYETLIN